MSKRLRGFTESNLLLAVNLYEQYRFAQETMRENRRYGIPVNGWQESANQAVEGLKNLGLSDTTIEMIKKQ